MIGNYNDKPITEPEADRFGISPFAAALAQSIRSLVSPEGSVVALNGPWGSGKSSAVNLILHNLKETAADDKIEIVNFACWWFRGEEALALAFFREIYAALNPSLGEQFKKLLLKIGARLLRAGSAVGPAIDFAGGSGAGSVASGAMDWLSSLIEQGENVEKLHKELSEALARQDRRFLIVIDDIDRLAPEEALLIFRLVKSVGRLPKIVYLLVYDRSLAEKIVSERFPAEGPHYLEKIVQAVFELPAADHADLCSQMLVHAQAIFGDNIDERDTVEFMNIFYDVVAPELRTPRDVSRIASTISVTWPPIAGNVAPADLMALETLRVLQPSLYNAIRSSCELLCGPAEPTLRGSQKGKDTEYDHLILGSIDDAKRPHYRRALMRLFPRLQSVWSNMSYSGESFRDWTRRRRVCAKEHFGAYFRLAVGESAVSKEDIDELISRADDAEFVEARLRENLLLKRRDGSTKTSVLLEQLNLYTADFSEQKIQPFVTTLFMLADDLHLASDEARGFGIGDNNLRLHWLIRRLTFDRFSLTRRTDIFRAACEHAALAWLIDFAESAYADYHPGEGKEAEPEDKCLVTKTASNELLQLAISRIAAASETEALARHRQLPSLLFSWRRLTGDNSAVQAWTGRQLDDDGMVVRFAAAFTSHSWSQSMGFAGLGDRVARKNVRAAVSSLGEIMDATRFRSRVEALASSDRLRDEDRSVISTFLAAWQRQDRSGRD